MNNKKVLPGILIGTGIAGLLGSIALAIKATPKACYQIAEKKEELGKEDEKLSVGEVIKATWKTYIPTLILALSSTGSIITGAIIQNKMIQEMSAVATGSAAALAGYQAKMIETLGTREAQKVIDGVAKEKLETKQLEDKKSGTPREVVFVKNKGTLIYDAEFGRYFMGDIDEIKSARDKINYRLDSEDMSVNEFYSMLDIPTMKAGEMFGWKEGQKMDLQFSAQLDEKGEPCIVIMYDFYPIIF